MSHFKNASLNKENGAYLQVQSHSEEFLTCTYHTVENSNDILQPKAGEVGESQVWIWW